MTFDLERLRETRRTQELGHDWSYDLEELFILIEGIVALQDKPDGRCRMFMAPGYGFYVFREWRENHAFKVQYFAHGEWHDTVEAVHFDEIAPWLKLSSPTDPETGSSPSMPAKSAGSAPSPTDAPENP